MKWLLAFFIVILSLPLKARDSSDFWILTHPEDPFIVMDDKGILHGLLVDEVNGILASAGIHQKILSAPWERVEREARIKSNVLAFALARTPEREDVFHWITPLTANVYSVYSSNLPSQPITKIEQLTSFESIAVLKNDVRHQILDKVGAENIHVYETWAEALDAVSSGHSSAIFFSDAGMHYYCKVQGKDCNQFHRVFLYEKTFSYLTLSKNGTDIQLANKLKSAAKNYKKTAKFKELTEHWLKQYETLPIPMHMEDGVLNLWIK